MLGWQNLSGLEEDSQQNEVLLCILTGGTFGVPADIRTEHLLNTNLERYILSMLHGDL
jgi:hypothetical protein